MAEIRLYYADCAGVPGNCSYPHEAVIEDAASLRRAVSRDYVCVAYKNSYRANANFRTTNCLGMDCDNDHSDNPEDCSISACHGDCVHTHTYQRTPTSFIIFLVHQPMQG